MQLEDKWPSKIVEEEQKLQGKERLAVKGGAIRTRFL